MSGGCCWDDGEKRRVKWMHMSLLRVEILVLSQAEGDEEA